MSDDKKQGGFRSAIQRLEEAHQSVLSESILFPRSILNSSKTKLVNTLISLLSQLIDYRAGCVWIVDERSLFDPQIFGDADRYRPEFERHYKDGLAGWVNESRKLQVVPAPQGCFILIPVVSKSGNYALVDLALDINVDQITPSTIELIETLSSYTSLALEQQNLEEWQKRAKRFLELLPERSTITDPATLLETVIGDIRSLLEVDSCSVMLVDHRTQSLKVAAASGLPDEFRHTNVKLGTRISGKVAQTGRVLFIEDSRQESGLDFPWRDSYEGRSIISIPLHYHGQVLGVLNATNRHSNRRLFRSDAALLELFAAHVAVAWQSAVLIGQLKLESTEWSALFDVIGEPVVVLSTQERLVKANKRAMSLFTRHADSAVGKRLSELLPEFADDLRRIFGGFAPAPNRKHELYATVDNQPMRLILAPVVNDSGAITGYIGHFATRKSENGTHSGLKSGNKTEALLKSILQTIDQARIAPATALSSELDKLANLAQSGLDQFKQADSPPVHRTFQQATLKTPTTAKKSILVVDDEIEMRELLKDILDMAGYDVTAVGSGPEAIAQLDRKQFNLVITDLGMPILNGWEV